MFLWRNILDNDEGLDGGPRDSTVQGHVEQAVASGKFESDWGDSSDLLILSRDSQTQEIPQNRLLDL